MPTFSQTFKAIITADSGSAVKDLRKFDGEVDKTTKLIASKADKIRGALGGVAFGAVAKKSIQAASDLEESINAVKVVFGDVASEVLKIGENAADSMGLSQSAFNGAAIQFSSFAKQIAGPGGDAAQVVEDLTLRAADFASVMNLDVNDAIGVFMSTLAGETEPIRRFGKNISAAAVESYILAEGIAETKAEITDAMKQQGRYELLMRETEETAGDFANTSDSLANSQRRLKANVENLAADLGSELLPAAASTTGAITDLLGVFKEMPGAAQDAATAVGVGAAAVAAFGAKATAAAATALSLLGAYEAIKAGVGGDTNSFIDSDQPFYVRPFQEAARFGRFIAEETDTDERTGAFARQTRLAQEAQRAAEQLDLAMFNNAASISEARASAMEYAEGLGVNIDALHFANLVASEWAGNQKAVAALHADMAREAGEAAAKEKMLADAEAARADIVDQVASVLDRKRALDEKAAAATEKHRQAVEDFLDEIDKNLDSIFDYEEATINAEDAVARLRDAQIDNIATQNDAEASDRDKAQSARDMRSAEIGAAEAVLRASEAYAIEQGAAEGSTEAAILQREALALMADQYPELRDEIALYIAELDRIPAIKTTQLILTRNTTNAQLRSVGASGVRVDENGNLRGLPNRSVGGRVPGAKGTPVPIMAHAGEYVLPTHAPMPAVSRSSGIHIGAINVTSQSGEVAPRDIVQAIARYERMNGPRYQAA